MRRVLRVLGWSLAVAVAFPAPGQAQTPAPPHLSELLPNLILREVTLPRPTVAGLSHEAHFSPIEGNELDNPAVGIVRNFNKLTMVQLSTQPLGSPAGGFTYTFDEVAGHVPEDEHELRPVVRRARPDAGPEQVQRRLHLSAHALHELRRARSQ